MKGQKLYIRRATRDDDAAIARFYASESLPAPDLAADGALLGKFLGEIVAHLVFTLEEPSRVTIEHLYVASAFRRKRVGKTMVSEAANLAPGPGRSRLAVRKDAATQAFFEHIGFRDAGEQLERET